MIKGWNKIVAKVAKQIFDKTQSGLISDEMVDAHAKHLLNGMFGNDAFTQPIGIKDNELAQITRDNVYIFSGAKNANQLKEFNALLQNADGSQKPFNQFLKDVKAVDKTYNTHYLKAEFNHAQNCARMIQKWQQIKGNSDALPYLKYRAVIDGKTRATHKSMNGIVKRWDDSFWNSFYPPNGWNCRCSVLQMAMGDVTPDKDIITPEDMKPIFKNNVGKNGMVYPKGNPYEKALSTAELKTVTGASLKLSKKATEENQKPKAAKKYPRTKVLKAEKFLQNHDDFKLITEDYNHKLTHSNPKKRIVEVDGVSKTEGMAIFGYTTEHFYEGLNKYLREEGKTNEYYNNLEIVINSGLDKLKSVKANVIRKIDFEQSLIDKYMEHKDNGLPYYHKQFLSASTDDKAINKKSIEIYIKSKTGKKVIDYSNFKFENEVLFSSNTGFKITQVATSNGNTVVIMEEI
ncbi:MAG TPA: phage minor head protein [Bacteroidia bacterium]|nr:phage minor head protein [Bacteroidia bacterium]